MRKIFSFLTAILFAGSMMAANYVKTAYADIQTDDVVIITMQNANGVYAASNDQGTSKAPLATAVTVADDAITTDATNILWTVTKDGENITFGAGEQALYCINSNNGVRVGSNADNVFSIDAESGYLFNNATSRYIGVYNSQDFRCYTSVNSNIKDQTLAFFVKSEGGDEPVVEPETKTIYLNGGGSSLWNQADPEFFVHSWGGAADGDVHMTLVEGDVYKADIPADNTDLLFLRLATGTTEIVWSGEAYWNQSANQTIPEGKDLFTMTSWDNGTWSVYTAQGGDDPEPVDPTPAEKDSIYFVNVAGWTAPRVHLWGGTAAGTEWPGVEMTKLEDQINNYDVYKYVADKGAYVKCIFSDNGENQTADLDWTSGKYFYNDTWYALNEIPAPLPDAVPLVGNIWKVTAETPLVAGSHYINEALLTMDGVYATSLKTNKRTIAGEEFTHAIQVRTDGYPTAENKAGKEKSGSTSLIITAKEDADVTFYYNRQVVGEGGTDNDNKDLIVFDQADITTKIAGVFTIDQILEGNNYMNVTKKVALKKDHTYTVTASGTTLQLHGIKLEAHFPVMQIAGAWNVQDEAWLLNNMSLAEDKLTATYEVELAKGDYEFKMIKDGAWLTKANEGQAYGLHREWPGVAGVIDNATENLKVTADVAGNYVFTWTFANDSIGIAFPDAPIEPTPNYYIIGAGEAFGAWSFVPVMQDTFKLSNLAAGDYMFRVALEEGNWENTKGYSDLTEKTEGLSANEDNNILFTLAEASDVAVVYNDTVFRVIGNFYVAPVVEPAKFYVTGDSALLADAADDATLAWNPSAIKAEADTLVLNLKAEQYYKLKVTLDGTWNTAKGFNDLTEKPAGVTMDNDENIIFSLAEAGAVQVIYIAGETPIFKLAGNFYVEPEQPTPNYYIIGAGEAFGEWSFVPVMQDTFKLSNLAAGDYMFRIAFEEGNWENTKGYSDLTEKTEGLSANEDNNILFTLAEAGDVAVVYNDTIFRVIGNFYVAPVEPTAKFYITGSANLVGEENEWQPNAIPVMEDSKVLALEAGDYMLKLTMNGTWEGENNVKGYDALTGEIPAGVTRGTGNNDDNICFTLAEAGNVTVTYTAEAFTIEGDFYVAPEPVKQYMLYGEAAIANGEDWNENSDINVMTTTDEGLTYTLTVEGVRVQGPRTFEFKIIEKGNNQLEYYPRQYGANAGLYIEESGIYTITFIYTVATQNCVADLQKTGDLEPAQVDYYLVGSFNEWTASDEYKFEVDPDLETQFILTATLAENDEFKVIKVEEGVAEPVWYPAEGDNYVVDAAHAGEKLIYFRPEYDGGDGWFAGCIYVAANPTPEPELTNGYYLVGTMNEWTPAAENLLAQNPDNDAEYQLAINLEVNDEIKVVYVENDAIVAWFPNEGDNYVIDDHHNGATTMYFRPDYQGGEDWFAGCIYVVPTSTVDITNIDANAEAVKVLRNGQIMIIKGTKTYNVMGQILK